MLEIRDLVNDEATKLGIEIVDVRIKRADLPEANSQAVYEFCLLYTSPSPRD